MSKINIEILRKEAQRQLQLLKELLQEAKEKGLVPAMTEDQKKVTSSDDKESFNTETLQETLQILDGESYKLDHLDMVLAVVGTVKAGKSTSINAIVGAEVLPNRNRPMTALPTLIRHTPEVLKPRLKFEKIKPLNDLLTKLSKAIKSPANRELLAQSQCDPEMGELLKKIQNNKYFAPHHEGEEKIFTFLKELNDLVRLCFALKVEFPFDSYATIDAMPIIEVEFSHLKNIPSTQGRLTLLDTPGPNEAGQQHLRHMLKDQLKKASAVLAVLDYGQLNSDADADVRENLIEISRTTEGRMYALVNKFDQKDRNSDNEVTVKQYVAQTLMRGTMTGDNVFPVSSLIGYLASRARNEIERRGKLPTGEPWVEDFGNLALGTLWDTEAASDTARMQKAADGLWKKSGFSLPLEKVIFAAHQNAALEALRSAASKLAEHSKTSSDFLNGRMGSLKGDANRIQEEIKKIQRNIEEIANIEGATAKSLEESLKNMHGQVKSKANDIKEEIRKGLNSYFKEGKRIEKDNLARNVNDRSSRKKKAEKAEPKSKDSVGSIISTFFPGGIKSPAQAEQDFDPGSSIINFDSKTEANDFRDKIEKSVRNAMHHAEESIKVCIQDGIGNFSIKMKQECIKSLEAIRNSVQHSVEGMDIQIRLPDVNNIAIKTSIHIILKDAIEEKSKIVKKYRRKSGAWGTVCKWFGTDDWGWEDYETTKDYYQVDLTKISKSSEAGLNTLFFSAEEVLNNDIYPQLQESSHALFSNFRFAIENIRSGFEQGLADQKLEKKEKDSILSDLEKMANKASSLQKECMTLSRSAEDLRRTEGVSVARGEVLA